MLIIDVEKEAKIQFDFMYKAIIDEAEVSELEGSDMQLFINARLRNVCFEQMRLRIIAGNNLRRNDTESLKKRNEEIIKSLLKGASQKDLARRNKMSGASVNKIVKKTIKEILGLNEESEKFTASQLVSRHKKSLTIHFLRR